MTSVEVGSSTIILQQQQKVMINIIIELATFAVQINETVNS